MEGHRQAEAADRIAEIQQLTAIIHQPAAGPSQSGGGDSSLSDLVRQMVNQLSELNVEVHPRSSDRNR